MSYTESYRDGWLAHRQYRREVLNPYDRNTQFFSHLEWQRGVAGRAITGLID